MISQPNMYAKAVKDGFITKRQSEKLNKPYLDYLIKRNKAKNHKPKRVSDEQWADYKAKRSESMRKAPKQPQKKTSDTSATAPTADNAKTKPRRSTRKKK